jgi:hypothetical protein
MGTADIQAAQCGADGIWTGLPIHDPRARKGELTAIHDHPDTRRSRIPSTDLSWHHGRQDHETTIFLAQA